MRNSFLFILAISLIIALLGVLSIYSSTSQKEGVFWQALYKRQIIWVLFGLLMFIFMSNFNYRRLWDATYFFYAAVLGLLALVFILGIIRLGAQRWLTFFWFNVQPSEIAKLFITIFLARYYSAKSLENISLAVSSLGVIRALCVPLAFVAVPTLFVMEQPDLGSAAMLTIIFLGMSYLAGVKLRYVVGLCALCAGSAPLIWQLLRSYQKERLLVFLNPNIDPLGAGYTVIQSKIAIGSGGLFGKGWLSGTQSMLRFLPESHTDFIFATYTEQWGLFGGGVLLVLYTLIVVQGFTIASRTTDQFGRLLAWGITLFFATQVLINIAMNLGIAPVVGLPLPLMSYGGSSLLVTFAGLGILVNIDRTRAVF